MVGKRVAGQGMKSAGIRRELAATKHQHFDKAAGVGAIAGERGTFFLLLDAGGATDGRTPFGSGNAFWSCIQTIIIDDKHNVHLPR